MSDERGAQRHEPSNTDAMGLDKRRPVTGGRYSPSVARQLTVYGVFVLVVVAIAFGAKLLIDDLDQPPSKIKDEAPWARPGVKQRPPPPLQ
jgi:hypothetical protein